MEIADQDRTLTWTASQTLADITRDLPRRKYLPPDDFALATGDELGPLRIERALGRGGMGEVYEAFDTRTDRFVALKLLVDDLDDAQQQERFLREGRLAARISHPHSVYVYGAEIFDDQPVILMELMPGGTLGDVVRTGGPLPVGAAVEAILQVIDGLSEAESLGVLHRDVKPDNCLLDEQGLVKVGDYGLSIPTDGRGKARITLDGAVAGTPSYASPEQLDGRPLDVRSDIYSVGATLYYLLTGKAPFEGESLMQLLSQVAQGNPRAPRKLRREVPGLLSDTVLACLRKRSSRRFRSYGDLRTALEPFAPSAESAGPARRLGAFSMDLLIACSMARLVLQVLGVHESWTRATPSISVLVVVAYFATFDVLGRTMGQILFQLGVSAERWTSSRVAARSAILLGPALLTSVVLWAAGLSENPVWALPLPFLGLLSFLPAHRAEGFRGRHERWTGTRVVRRPIRRPLPEAVSGRRGRSLPENAVTVGGFALYGSLPTGDETVLGADPVLERDVWIVRRDASEDYVRTPGMPAHRRLAEVGSTELAGEVETDVTWHVYEALSGAPLFAFTRGSFDWGLFRTALIDFASQLHGLPEQVRVEGQRLWIDGAWRGRVLAVAPPGMRTHGDGEGAALSPMDLLAEATRRALVGEGEDELPADAPVTARRVLDQLLNGDLATPAELVEKLRKVETREAQVGSSQIVKAIFGPGFVLGAVLLLLPVALALTLSASAFEFWLRWPVLLLGAQSLLASWGLMLAISLRGGTLLKLQGLDLVTARGEPVTRLQSAVRSVAGHAPVWVGSALFVGWETVRRLAFGETSAATSDLPLWRHFLEGLRLPPVELFPVSCFFLTTCWIVVQAAMLVGCASWLSNPSRGLQDRIAGTVIVSE